MQHAMKKTALMVALLAGSAASQAEWSANMALTTDYVWRGYSQSDESPAIQGGIDYSHDSGFYLGTWASSVDFDEGIANPADMEWDLYGGFGGELSNGLGYDIGLIYYGYPDADAVDGWLEGYLNVSYPVSDKVGVNAGVAYSSDVYGANEDGVYLSAGLDFALPNDIGLGVSVGQYNFDNWNDDTDWKIGLTKNIGGFDFELAYTDTDVDNNAWADSRIFLMVSKSM